MHRYVPFEMERPDKKRSYNRIYQKIRECSEIAQKCYKTIQKILECSKMKNNLTEGFKTFQNVIEVSRIF